MVSIKTGSVKGLARYKLLKALTLNLCSVITPSGFVSSYEGIHWF